MGTETLRDYWKIPTMMTKLQKYKYDGQSNSRPSAALEQSEPDNPSQRSPLARQQHTEIEAEMLKSDNLPSMRLKISSIITDEMKTVLSEDFGYLKNEMQALRLGLANSTMAVRAEIDRVKVNIKEVEGSLSTWSDEVVAMQNTVAELKT